MNARKILQDAVMGMSYVFLVLGIAIFFLGFHSIDLTQHFYYRNGLSNDYVELTLIGDEMTIDDAYMMGLKQIIVGFFMFGIGNAFFIAGASRR